MIVVIFIISLSKLCFCQTANVTTTNIIRIHGQDKGQRLYNIKKSAQYTKTHWGLRPTNLSDEKVILNLVSYPVHSAGHLGRHTFPLSTMPRPSLEIRCRWIVQFIPYLVENEYFKRQSGRSKGFNFHNNFKLFIKESILRRKKLSHRNPRWLTR